MMGHIIEVDLDVQADENQKSWKQNIHYIKIRFKSEKWVGKLANILYLYSYEIRAIGMWLVN